MTTNLTRDAEFLSELTPTQDHFLKKYLLETQLSHEIHYLSKPNCLEYLGFPFKSSKEEKLGDEKPKSQGEETLPLLKYFFSNFIQSFPFITNNPEKDQLEFWRDTVQPFVESFNTKNVSDSLERKDEITKRKQVNTKLLHGLLLFYNSMLISEKDLNYLHEDHLKPSDTGKLDKLQKGAAAKPDDFQTNVELDDFKKFKYVNDLSLNIIAVKRVGDWLNIERKPSNSSVTSGQTMERSSSWNVFKHIPIILSATLNNKPKHNYEFIIQVTKRLKNDNGAYEYRSHFVSRPYHDFKLLESKLKKKYPGLMATDIPALPSKLKHDDGVSMEELDSTILSQSDSKSLEADTVLVDEDPKPGNIKIKLYREKLRLALRGYLSKLVKHVEIVQSEIFTHFIYESAFEKLSIDESIDREERLEHEKSIIVTQREFQQQTAKIVYELSQDFDQFKEQLISNPESLSEIFKELSESKSIDELSPLLKTFLEWCKLEVAATLYQVFLGQDNSSEWLIKCQKFHRLFPYNIIYGILKFTNPVKVVSRVVDLLLVNFPSFLLPSWPGSSSKENDELKTASKKTGAKNLLSMMFVMLLDEDLGDYEKEIKQLLEGEVLKDGKYNKFINKIDKYVALEKIEVIDEIKTEAMDGNEDLLLTILKTAKCGGFVISDQDEKYQEILKSYKSYESLDGTQEISNSELYLTLKQYWQLLIRRRDKDIMKQLWQEPELTQLIKKFLTIFYQPLMKIFKKCDIHLVFKDFEKFMDDLMKELGKLNNGEVFYMSSIEIFNKFKKILDKHQIVLWRFINDLYNKDDQKLFIKLIKWIENFLKLLRMKYINESSVKLNLTQLSSQNDLDINLFWNQLNNRIENILTKRRLLKDYLQQQAAGEEEDHQQMIDSKWDDVNNDIFRNTDGKEFGIDARELEEFNLLQKHQDSLKEKDVNNKEKQELYKKLASIDKSMNDLGTSELDKFESSFQIQLTSLLANINMN